MPPIAIPLYFSHPCFEDVFYQKQSAKNTWVLTVCRKTNHTLTVCLKMAITSLGSAQKIRVGRESGNTLFFLHLTLKMVCFDFCILSIYEILGTLPLLNSFIDKHVLDISDSWNPRIIQVSNFPRHSHGC